MMEIHIMFYDLVRQGGTDAFVIFRIEMRLELFLGQPGKRSHCDVGTEAETAADEL